MNGPALNRLLNCDCETRNNPDYFWDNTRRGRPDLGVMVVQLTCSGTGFIEKDGRHHEVPEGHVMLFAHGEDSRYGYQPNPSALPYRLEYVSFVGAGVRPVFDELNARFGPVFPFPNQFVSYTLFQNLQRNQQQRMFHDRYHESLLIYRFILELLRERSTHSASPPDPVLSLYERIQNHFLGEPVSLKAFAAESGLSREHLTRKFSRRYHEPPATLQRRLRLDYARSLVLSTQLSFTEVARRTGYPDLNTFTRAYRRHFSHSPSEERIHS